MWIQCFYSHFFVFALPEWLPGIIFLYIYFLNEMIASPLCKPYQIVFQSNLITHCKQCVTQILLWEKKNWAKQMKGLGSKGEIHRVESVWIMQLFCRISQWNILQWMKISFIRLKIRNFIYLSCYRYYYNFFVLGECI